MLGKKELDSNNNNNQTQSKLNGTNKNTIEGYLTALIFDDIAELPLISAILALQTLKAIKKREWHNHEIEFFKHVDIWSGVEELEKIFDHPYPQNRYQGNPNAFIHGYLKGRTTDLTQEEKIGCETGVFRGLAYYYSADFGSIVLTEPQGLLSLTTRNKTAPPRVDRFFLASELPKSTLQVLNESIFITNKDYTIGPKSSNHALKLYYINQEVKVMPITIDNIATLDRELLSLGMSEILTEKSADPIPLHIVLEKRDKELPVKDHIKDKFKTRVIEHSDLGAAPINRDDVIIYIKELIDERLKNLLGEFYLSLEKLPEAKIDFVVKGNHPTHKLLKNKDLLLFIHQYQLPLDIFTILQKAQEVKEEKIYDLLIDSLDSTIIDAINYEAVICGQTSILSDLLNRKGKYITDCDQSPHYQLKFKRQLYRKFVDFDGESFVGKSLEDSYAELITSLMYPQILLYLAAQKEHAATVITLNKYFKIDLVQILEIAIQLEDVAAVKTLIACGVDPNAAVLSLINKIDVNGKMMTRCFTHLALMQVLLSNKLDPNLIATSQYPLIYFPGIYDSFGPITSSVQHKAVEVVKLLLQRGANPNSGKLKGLFYPEREEESNIQILFYLARSIRDQIIRRPVINPWVKNYVYNTPTNMDQTVIERLQKSLFKLIDCNINDEKLFHLSCLTTLFGRFANFVLDLKQLFEIYKPTDSEKPLLDNLKKKIDELLDLLDESPANLPHYFEELLLLIVNTIEIAKNYTSNSISSSLFLFFGVNKKLDQELNKCLEANWLDNIKIVDPDENEKLRFVEKVALALESSLTLEKWLSVYSIGFSPTYHLKFKNGTLGLIGFVKVVGIFEKWKIPFKIPNFNLKLEETGWNLEVTGCKEFFNFVQNSPASAKFNLPENDPFLMFYPKVEPIAMGLDL